MAAPTFIGVETATGLAVDSIAIPTSGGLASVQEGDLLLALIAYGDNTASPDAFEGWHRLTGKGITEDGEADNGGEIVFRFAPATMPDEFEFPAAVTSSMAVAVFAYRDVDVIRTVDSSGETAEAAAGAAHAAPSIATVDPDEPVRLVSAYFFWSDPGAITEDGGQTKRGEAVAVGSVGVMAADESFASPGASGTRTAGSGNAVKANSLNIALTAVSGDMTAFDAELGGEAGRIIPAGYAAPEGFYAFVLGSDLAEQFADLEVGDFTEVRQNADFDTAKIVRVTVRTRAPAAMPAGLGWKFSIRIDGGERVSQILELDDDDTRDREFGVNVSALSGDHELAFRLELVNV